jgi:exonuclease SbcC
VILEKEYKGFRKKRIELQSKLKDIKVTIEKSKSEYENIMESRSNIEEELKLKKSERENLIKGCPGDNNLIISKKEKINEIEIRLNEAENNLAKWNSIQENNKGILSKKQELQGKIDKLNTNLSEKKEYMEKLKQEIHDIEFRNKASLIAAELKEGEPCPVCGSLHHLKVASPLKKDCLPKRKMNLLH